MEKAGCPVQQNFFRAVNCDNNQLHGGYLAGEGVGTHFFIFLFDFSLVMQIIYTIVGSVWIGLYTDTSFGRIYGNYL
jgi:uncharacterized membrane protein YagU involved in acid resistance